jgi:hypothetical protein
MIPASGDRASLALLTARCILRGGMIAAGLTCRGSAAPQLPGYFQSHLQKSAAISTGPVD